MSYMGDIGYMGDMCDMGDFVMVCFAIRIILMIMRGSSQSASFQSLVTGQFCIMK